MNGEGNSSIFRSALAILCAFILVPGDTLAYSPQSSAATPQSAGGQAPQLSPDQLDSLVAPIALYPDPLLAQVLAASTYPLEIVLLQRWLEQNKNLKDQALADAVAKQNWDASVEGLAATPDVVKLLSDNIQWTSDLGNAFLAQQKDVMDAVQRMRRKAQDKGTLKSTPQQTVETQTIENRSVVVIEPANQEVLYVPSYDPAVVYGPPVYPYPPVYYPGYYAAGAAISFGLGVMMGAWWSGGWGWGCGWGGGNVYVNHFNNFNRNTISGGRIGGVGGVGRPGGVGGIGGVGRPGGVGGVGGVGKPGGPGGIGGVGGVGKPGGPGGIGGVGGVGKPGGPGGVGGVGKPGGPGGVGGVGGNRPSTLPAGVGNNGLGNWTHNPAHRGGAPYPNRATADRFGGTARGDSLAKRQAGARQQISRQGGNLTSRAPSAGFGNRAGSGVGSANRAGGSGPGAGGADRIGGRNLSPGGAGDRSAFGGGSGRFNGSGARSNSNRGSSSMGSGGFNRGSGGFNRGSGGFNRGGGGFSRGGGGFSRGGGGFSRGGGGARRGGGGGRRR